ncbi:MAG TPA: hypothetical protein VHJ17_03630 [Thermomonospora sp.]|nr:hypothetical protein [Thermomonospora sp.]
MLLSVARDLVVRPEALTGDRFGLSWQEFGRWYTAHEVSRQYTTARDALLVVLDAVVRNLAEFGKRLPAVSDHYRLAEQRTENLLRRFLDPGAAAWPAPEAPARPPAVAPASAVYGDLPVRLATPQPDRAFCHSPAQITSWLLDLNTRRTWEAHGRVARGLRNTALALHQLRRNLYEQAGLLAEGWSDAASPLAQATLQRIEATVGGLAVFAGDLSAQAWQTALALEEVLRTIPPGIERADAAVRDHVLGGAFDDLTHRYREVVGAYPASLAFDLPFGGIAPLHGRSPGPTLPPPGPAPSVTAAPASPVIGGAPYTPVVDDQWPVGPVIGGSTYTPPADDGGTVGPVIDGRT